MTYRLPFPIVENFDPHGPYRNPGQTNPLPAPTNIPTPCWFGGSVPVTWVNVGGADPDVEWQATWASPIFDMRPDIRNVTPDTSATAPGKWTGTPMWNPSAHLWVQLENPGLPPIPPLFAGVVAQDLRGFQVLMDEQAHISNPQRLQTISNPEDITTQFASGRNSMVFGFYPVGNANPLRYWRVMLIFNVRKRFQAPEPLIAPAFTISSAMY